MLQWFGLEKGFCYFFKFQDGVSLRSPGCPGPHSIDQVGLGLEITTTTRPEKV